jgi:hypothetical protein
MVPALIRLIEQEILDVKTVDVKIELGPSGICCSLATLCRQVVFLESYSGADATLGRAMVDGGKLERLVNVPEDERDALETVLF